MPAQPNRDSGPPDTRAADAGVPLDWARARAHLAAHGLRLDENPPPRQFAGGLANLNYLISLDGSLAVLRRPPLGDLPPGSHDMAREHRILSRLPNALAFVPRSLHLCTDVLVIGAPFQILEYRAGLVVRSSMPPELDGRPEAGARLSQVLVETLAAVHSVDADAIGLGDLGRPEGFLGRTVAGWSKRGLAAKEDSTDAVHRDVQTWLGRNAVPDGAPTLLHNDFKLDNMILDPTDLSPLGVVDWDQGTRGDPLMDLATLLTYWTKPGDPQALFDMAQMPTTAAGFWSREETVARYAKLSGRDLSDFRFFRVLAMYKLGVIFLQLGFRYRTGATTEARYAPLSGIGTGIVAFAHDIACGRAF